MVHKTVGEILVKNGALTTEQLKTYLQASSDAGQTIEQYLLTNNIVTPEQIAQAYAEYASLEYISEITEDMTDADLLAQVPLRFLRDNLVIPVRHNNTLYILTANPVNFQPLDEINMILGGKGVYAVAPSPVIIDAVNRYYPLEGSKRIVEELEEEDKELETVELGDIEEKDIVAMAAEAPIIKLVNHILFQAVKRGASDIHIEPYEKEVHVRYRIDGVLYEVMKPPKRLQDALVSRIKIMSNLNIAEKRIPQDGRIDIKVVGKAIDIRVSILPVTFGERIVMRLLDKTRSFSDLKRLGFSNRDYALITREIAEPNGIIYVTGPTGSGKTSTLYSILAKLNTPEVNIITVEDPVEYQMAGIAQVQVKDKIGLTFAAALRSILRQDPDIVMIGETRDQETAQIAVQAALTGHLVLSTLHTNSAPATITRLIDMGVEPFLIASSVNVILAQRLVRRLCPDCKKVEHPTAEMLKSVGITQEEAKTITFYAPGGCKECNGSGYKGRLAIFELMEMTEAIGNLTIERADTTRIRKQAIKDGMTLLVQDGVRKIKEGLTTIAEVLTVATLDTHEPIEPIE